MAAQSIPETIAAHTKITPAGKLTFSDLFSCVRKGEQPTMSLGAAALTVGLVGEGEYVAGIRSLEKNGYASIDETFGKLEDVIRDQEVRIGVRLVVEVQPLAPMDDASIEERRYWPEDNKPAWDIVKIGRMVYRANVSRFMTEYSLSVRARHGDAVDQTTLIEGRPFPSMKDAWDWFDEWMVDLAERHEQGEVLPGAAGDDPHFAVVSALVECGYDEAEAREASEATIGEGDPDMRIAAAKLWLAKKHPPLALPAPGDGADEDPDRALFIKAAWLAVENGGITNTGLRDALGIGIEHARRIGARLEAAGIVGKSVRGNRRLLLSAEEVAVILAHPEPVEAEVVEHEEGEESSDE